MADADVATTSDNKNIDLPKALIRRMVKAKLSELSGDPSKEFNVNKDALLALAESAKVFVSFIASTANDICKESKRQTMSAEDVFKALDEMDFGDMVAPLRQELAGKPLSRACSLIQFQAMRVRSSSSH